MYGLTHAAPVAIAVDLLGKGLFELTAAVRLDQHDVPPKRRVIACSKKAQPSLRTRPRLSSNVRLRKNKPSRREAVGNVTGR